MISTKATIWIIQNNFFGLDGFLVKSVKFWAFLEKNDQKYLSKIPKGYLNFTIFNADFKSFYRFEIAYLVRKIFEFWWKKWPKFKKLKNLPLSKMV